MIQSPAEKKLTGVVFTYLFIHITRLSALSLPEFASPCVCVVSRQGMFGRWAGPPLQTYTVQMSERLLEDIRVPKTDSRVICSLGGVCCSVEFLQDTGAIFRAARTETKTRLMGR